MAQLNLFEIKYGEKQGFNLLSLSLSTRNKCSSHHGEFLGIKIFSSIDLRAVIVLRSLLIFILNCKFRNYYKLKYIDPGNYVLIKLIYQHILH